MVSNETRHPNMTSLRQHSPTWTVLRYVVHASAWRPLVKIERMAPMDYVKGYFLTFNILLIKFYLKNLFSFYVLHNN